MARLPYPPLALDTITQAIDIVRAGLVVEKSELFANLMWNVQGPLQSLVFGNPDKPAAAAVPENADPEAHLDERLDRFAWILECARSQYHAVATATDLDADLNAIDPATILAIVNIALQLIDAWRKRRQNPQPAPQPIPQA